MKNLIFLLNLTIISFAVYCQSADSATQFYRKGLEEKNNKLFLVAYNDFKRSVTLNPSNADAQRELGLTAVELRNYQNAEIAFLKLNELKPNDPVAIDNLAHLYFWMHKWPDAVKYAEKAIQLKPGKDWNYMLAKSYYEQEDYGHAFRYMKVAAQEDSTNAEIPYMAARAYVDMSNYKAAAPMFRKAISLDSAKPQWIYECALTYAAIPDDKSAIPLYLLAAEKGYKTNNDYFDNLSQSYIGAGMADKGLELMLKLLDKKPADMDLLNGVADTYYHMKKYPEAIEYWDKVLGLDKSNARALYMIGLSYQKKGDKQKGQQLCDKAIEMDPSLRNLKTEKKMDM